MHLLDRFSLKIISNFPFSLIHRTFVPGNAEVQLRQRNSELKIARMTAMSVIAFMLSWAPYCVVSLAAVFTRDHVIANGEAETPELLAKASVIYNPVIYTIMNSRFRATLFRILRVRRNRTNPEVLIITTRNQHSLRQDTNHHHGNIELFSGLHLTTIGRRVSRNHITATYVEQNTLPNTESAAASS